MTIVEGLEGGRWALATKTHHCMVDGVGSVDVSHLILDATPGAPPSPSAPASSADAARARSHTGSGPIQPLAALARKWKGLLPLDAAARAAAMGIHSTLHPREALKSAQAAAELIVREELHAAPRTSVNEAIGTRRRFRVIRVPMEDMKAIKNALGGTINDVALSATASGLRALLLARGETLPEQGLRAMVPINVRHASEHLALGNRISSLFVDLPVADPDTLERYYATVARSAALKSDGRQAAATQAVIELAGLAPPVLHSTIARALYATRLFNLTITNVPGPKETLYAFGAPLREIHPLVPLAASHAVGVAILSYDGTAFFGVVADRDSVPDLDVLLGGIEDSLAELKSAAGGPKSRKRTGAPRSAAGAAAAPREHAGASR
jgi:WS/DGAT/MGAT family acyltransferase